MSVIFGSRSVGIGKSKASKGAQGDNSVVIYSFICFDCTSNHEYHFDDCYFG